MALPQPHIELAPHPEAQLAEVIAGYRKKYICHTHTTIRNVVAP
jgi:hypothetical protein